MPRGRVRPFIAGVIVAALAVGVGVLLRTGGDILPRALPSAVWVLGLFALLGELLPVRIVRRSEVEEIATSTGFVFATLISFGLPTAMLVCLIASAIGDVVHRKQSWKVAFNAGQYALSLAVAAVVLHLLGTAPQFGSAGFELGEIPPMLLAAAAFFLVNNTITGAALALAQEVPVRSYLARDFWFQASTAGAMLSFAPIIHIVAEANLVFVPLLTLPAAALYKSTNIWIEKQYKDHQAVHDALTGLPNRVLFRERVQRELGVAAEEGSRVAIMLIDLDRFKEINDTLGHHAGDLLLQQVGPRLEGALRTGDTVARLGGDEFAVLVPNVADELGATMVADKLLRALSDPFEIDGLHLDIDGSIGIAVFPTHGDDHDALMRRADVAMYVAKETQSGHEVYSPTRDRYSPERLSMVGQLRRAIDNRELFLHYQPKIDLATRQLAGVEALVRWNHPEQGLLAAGVFVPLTEHTGLIRSLTSLVLEDAVRQCAEWREQGLDIPVAVNLSVRNLHDAALPDEIARLLRARGVPASRLKLEITESAIMVDPYRAMGVLARLTDMGLGLAIDDFGSGHSSLAYLKRLPVSELKIDRSFVQYIGSDPSDAAIVRSTIELGRNLGLEVVAEGVEDEAAVEHLLAFGCRVAQGYHLGRPMPAEAITEVAHAERALTVGVPDREEQPNLQPTG